MRIGINTVVLAICGVVFASDRLLRFLASQNPDLAEIQKTYSELLAIVAVVLFGLMLVAVWVVFMTRPRRLAFFDFFILGVSLACGQVLLLTVDAWWFPFAETRLTFDDRNLIVLEAAARGTLLDLVDIFRWSISTFEPTKNEMIFDLMTFAFRLSWTAWAAALIFVGLRDASPIVRGWFNKSGEP